MKKEKYFQTIQNNLNVFKETEVKTIITDLENEYNRLAKEDKNEETIIKKMPSVEDVIKKAYDEHGLNYQKVNKNNNIFKRKLEELFSIINHMVEVMSKNDFQSNMKIIVDIVILILFICLIKIPFILVRNLGESVLQYFKTPIFLNIWGLVIDIAYIIIAIMIFINIFTKWFKDIKNTFNENKKAEPKKLGKELTSITLEEKDDNENQKPKEK